MFYQELLLQELSQRQARNPGYSLRALAASLGVSPTLLSHLLSGKRPLTRRTASLLATRLALDPPAATKLVAESGPPKGAGKTLPPPIRHKELTQEEFRLVADWEHYAVLALSSVPGNRWDPQWISERLNISQKRAADVLARLEKLGYAVKRGQGFAQVTPQLATTQDVPSAAIKKYHSQNLEKANASLFQDAVSKRYFGSATLAIDPADLPKLKSFLRKARARLQSLAQTKRPTRVYHYSVQLFPIDRGEEPDDHRH